MINLLMRQPAVILENVVVFGAGGLCELLGDGLEEEGDEALRSAYKALGQWEIRHRTTIWAHQNVGQVLVGDVQKFGTVVLGDH